MRQQRAFTLVELLVVIGIIAVLIAILLPTLSRARRQAQVTVCLSNERQLVTALLMYCQENKSYFPGGTHYSTGFYSWYHTGARNPYSCNRDETVAPTFLMKYVSKSKDIARCPAIPSIQETGASHLDETTNYWYPISLVIRPEDCWKGLFDSNRQWPQKLTSVRYPVQKVVIIEWKTWHEKQPVNVNLLPNGQDSTGKEKGRKVVAGFADGHAAVRDTYEMLRTDVNWTGAGSIPKEAGVLGKDFR